MKKQSMICLTFLYNLYNKITNDSFGGFFACGVLQECDVHLVGRQLYVTNDRSPDEAVLDA